MSPRITAERTLDAGAGWGDAASVVMAGLAMTCWRSRPAAPRGDGLVSLTGPPLPIGGAPRTGGRAVRCTPFHSRLGSEALWHRPIAAALDATRGRCGHRLLSVRAGRGPCAARTRRRRRYAGGAPAGAGPGRDGEVGSSAGRAARGSVASVWDRQFGVREPRVTLWIFQLAAGEACAGTPLPECDGAHATMAVPSQHSSADQAFDPSEPAPPSICLPTVLPRPASTLIRRPFAPAPRIHVPAAAPPGPRGTALGARRSTCRGRSPEHGRGCPVSHDRQGNPAAAPERFRTAAGDVLPEDDRSQPMTVMAAAPQAGSGGGPELRLRPTHSSPAHRRRPLPPRSCSRRTAATSRPVRGGAADASRPSPGGGHVGRSSCRPRSTTRQGARFGPATAHAYNAWLRPQRRIADWLMQQPDSGPFQSGAARSTTIRRDASDHRAAAALPAGPAA